MKQTRATGHRRDTHPLASDVCFSQSLQTANDLPDAVTSEAQFPHTIARHDAQAPAAGAWQYTQYSESGWNGCCAGIGVQSCPMKETLGFACIALWTVGCATAEAPCDTGTTRCDGLCTDLASDFANCGECGARCAPGETCDGGLCAAACPAGLDLCGTECVDDRSDPDHCGGCDEACAGGEVCVDAGCDATCPAPRIACAGACVDPMSDAGHCGGCDVACEAGLVCSEGECDATCQSELVDCAGSCVDTTSDLRHCGKCGHECDPGNVCVGGACVRACPPGQMDCGGRCVDTLRDRARCGGCAIQCEDGEYCEAGVCTLTCTAGSEPCDGACVDTDHDPVNCGLCGVDCGASNVCVDGACVDIVDFSHRTGYGQTWFDAVPTATYDLTQATRACEEYIAATLPAGDSCNVAGCGCGGGGDECTYNTAGVGGQIRRVWFHRGVYVGNTTNNSCAFGIIWD